MWIALVIGGCQPEEKENVITGKASLIVDESIFPIVDDEWLVFSSIYTHAHINMVYRSEGELLKDFLSQKIQIAILSRQLSPYETRYYQQKNIRLRITPFAKDALVLITQKTAPDCTLSYEQLQALVSKKTSQKLVFDNTNSSVLKHFFTFIKQPIKNAKNSYALKSTPQVIHYVAHQKGSIGLIGLSWLLQAPPDIQKELANLKTIALQSSKDGKYYHPSQTTLADGTYPLTRNLYIYDAQGKAGLGLGFASFLASERGQRIILKSGLLPYKIPSREVIIKKQIHSL